MRFSSDAVLLLTLPIAPSLVAQSELTVTGRFAMIYGGGLLRTAVGEIRNGNMAKCPLTEVASLVDDLSTAHDAVPAGEFL